MSEVNEDSYKWVLLTESYEFGDFMIEGVFDTRAGAHTYIEEELSSQTKYDIRRGRYYK